MPDTAEPRDIELMRRLSTGDEDAFLEFYRRHQGGVYRYAVHITGRPEAAADVVQETFLTLIRQAGKFDEEKGAPGAFLYGIARNHVRKLHEKESRYVEVSTLLACPVGTVRSRLNRARSILLEKLRPNRAGTKALGVRLGGKS